MKSRYRILGLDRSPKIPLHWLSLKRYYKCKASWGKFMKLLNFILNFFREKHKKRITKIVSCYFPATNFFKEINHFFGYLFRVRFLIFADVFNFCKITQTPNKVNRNFIIFIYPNFSQFINYRSTPLRI